MVVSALLAVSLVISPLTQVKEGNAAVQRALKAKDVSADKIANTVESYVDFGELAKRALGKEWDKLSKAQQQDFAATMKGVLRASYAQKAIGEGQADVKYGKETVEENEATVETTITVKKADYPVVYKLYRANAKAPWRVYDVITDDVSLMETYRDQFRTQIAQKGFDGLLNTLKKKRDELEKGPAQTRGGRRYVVR
jgi:phospholipid transport system substrate-binding protein